MVGAFTWGSGGQAVPSEEAMRRRARISEILLQNALSGQPAQHWSDGIAKGVNILAAGYFDKQNRDAEQTGKQELQASIAQMLGGEAAPAAAPQGGGNPLAGVQPMAMGSDLDRAANAITSIESGGRYDALGPVTKSGDRAFGRYQVMGENIPSWTEQYVGRRMTPQEFLASQEAQDAVFRGEFGRLKQKHGPEGAARAWFAGEGGMNNPNARDILGTSVADYSRKFTSAFAPGQAPAAAPQVAQAGGAAPQPASVPQGGMTQDRLRAAYNVLNSPFAGPADKAIAQTIIQKALTAETRDPRDSQLKDLSVQEKRLGIKRAERDLNMVEMDRITDPATGALLERPKGTNQPFQPVQGTGPKAPETTTDQRELAQINKERVAAGLPAFRMDEYKFQKARANATTINNDLSGGSGKQVFDAMMAQTDTARAAASGLNALREARKAVEGGGFFGAGADARLGFAKIGQLLGFEDGRIVNTETFRAAIAPQIAAMMKATVGSTQISNADREFAEKAAGGSIALDERSVKRLLDIMERGSTAVVDRHLEMLDEVYPDGPDRKFARERALMNVRVRPPPTALPADPGNLQPPAPPQPGKVLRYNPQTGALE